MKSLREELSKLSNQLKTVDYQAKRAGFCIKALDRNWRGFWNMFASKNQLTQQKSSHTIKILVIQIIVMQVIISMYMIFRLIGSKQDYIENKEMSFSHTCNISSFDSFNLHSMMSIPFLSMSFSLISIKVF